MERVDNSFWASIVKGILFSVIISLVSVLIFGFIVQMSKLDSGVIKAVNQFIKIISVFLACTLSLKDRAGLISGIIIGVISTVITYLLFCLFFGTVSFGISFFIDLVFMLIIGGISGIISVNLKR